MRPVCLLLTGFPCPLAGLPAVLARPNGVDYPLAGWHKLRLRLLLPAAAAHRVRGGVEWTGNVLEICGHLRQESQLPLLSITVARFLAHQAAYDETSSPLEKQPTVGDHMCYIFAAPR